MSGIGFRKYPLIRDYVRLTLLLALILLCSVVGSGSVYAAPIVYTTNLSGPNESPPTVSLGTGIAQVTIDVVAHTMRVQVTFSGLTGNTTAAHIHGPTATPGVGTAGVATQTPTFSGFPLGVTSGTYDNTFDTTLASTFNPAFVTANGGTAAGAEAALAASMAAGTAYFNIHTDVFPGGEIRGFLSPVTAVPTLSEWGMIVFMVLAGLGSVYYLRRQKRIESY